MTEFRQNRNKVYEIEFDEYNGVKFRKLVTSILIKRKNIKNPYFPVVCGIGFTGSADVKSNRREYDRWRNMINRCYNIEDIRYKSYGGNGVTVCQRWLSFERFLEDIVRIEGYSEENIDNISLDKDTKVKGNKIYSPSTCVFISKGDNTREMNSRINPKKQKENGVVEK